MKSTCCSAEIVDDWDVWRCSECKKSLAYNTFRKNTFESQLNEKNTKEFSDIILYIYEDYAKDMIAKNAMRYIFDYGFQAGKNGWISAEIFFNNYEFDGREHPTHVIVKLKSKKE